MFSLASETYDCNICTSLLYIQKTSQFETSLISYSCLKFQSPSSQFVSLTLLQPTGITKKFDCELNFLNQQIQSLQSQPFHIFCCFTLNFRTIHTNRLGFAPTLSHPSLSLSPFSVVQATLHDSVHKSATVVLKVVDFIA